MFPTKALQCFIFLICQLSLTSTFVTQKENSPNSIDISNSVIKTVQNEFLSGEADFKTEIKATSDTFTSTELPDGTFTEPSITSTSTTKTTTITTTEPPYPVRGHFFPNSSGNVMVVIFISFLIPTCFMGLIFWRLHKEKKYLDERAGALVFRETIIVPSHIAHPSSENGVDSMSNNAVQMHAILYDLPPEYDAAITTTIPVSELKEKCEMSEGNEVPPPAYTTIHF